MDPSVITGLAALGGSLVGAFSSFATTYVTQRHQGRRKRIMKDVERREMLYGRFVDQAAKQFIDSLDKNLDNPAQLIEMIGVAHRISLSAAPEVVEACESVMRELMASYERPAIDPREFIALTKQEFTDPLKKFTVACRAERERLLSEL